MATLEKAISIAIEAHEGIVDKSSTPYILHPLRLMLQMNTQEEMIAAVLHDVIEDSDYNLSMLREFGFSEDIIEAVDSLSKRQDESYEDFIKRAGSNDLGRKIKYADLMDNLDISRLEKLTDRDLNRIKKYHNALAMLQDIEPQKKPDKNTPYTLFLGEI